MVGWFLLLDLVVLRPSQGFLRFEVVIILHASEVIEGVPFVAQSGLKRCWLRKGILSLNFHAWWRPYLHHCICAMSFLCTFLQLQCICPVIYLQRLQIQKLVG